MDCKKFEHMIRKGAERSLSTNEQTMMEKHRQECKSCSDLQLKVNLTMNLIDHLPKEEPKPFYTTRVMQRIQAETDVWYSLIPQLKGRTAALTSGAILAFCIGLGVFFGGQISFTFDTSSINNSEYLAQEYYLDEILNTELETYVMDSE